MGQKDMEFIHEIFGDEIRPTNHVNRVTKDWHENFVTDLIEVFHDDFVCLHENYLIYDVLGVQDDVVIWIWHLGRSGS
jgi:hypothetical protein